MAYYVVNLYFSSEKSEEGFKGLKPFKSYNNLTKVKAQDIFAVFKSSLFKGQDSFARHMVTMSGADKEICDKTHVFKTMGIEVTKRNKHSYIGANNPANYDSVAMIKGSTNDWQSSCGENHDDFKLDNFIIKTIPAFEAKRDDVMYRRLDLANLSGPNRMSASSKNGEQVYYKRLFRTIKGRCHVALESFGDVVLALQQHDNNPRQFKLVKLSLDIWESGFISGSDCKGCAFDADDVFNAYMYHKEKGIFDFYVEYKDVSNDRRYGRQLFINEEVTHYKGGKYHIFDFVYNATTDDIDVLYVKKMEAGGCSNIQFTRNYKEFLSYVVMSDNNIRHQKINNIYNPIKEVMLAYRFECDCDISTEIDSIDELQSLVYSSSNSTNYDCFVDICIKLNKYVEQMTRHKRKSQQDIYLYRV